MSIRKGTDWGRPEPVPDDAIFVNNDAEANEAVSASRRARKPTPPLCLLGGDLARTLGVADNEASLRAGEGTHVQIDLGMALVDGRLVWFVSHLVARRSWWRGPIVIAANAAFMGDYNVAPKAHPGDGRLDLIEADPSFSERLKARSRLRSGTHVPHPQIKIRRCRAAQLELTRSTPVALDGISIGEARTLSIRVEPEALDVWI